MKLTIQSLSAKLENQATLLGKAIGAKPSKSKDGPKYVFIPDTNLNLIEYLKADRVSWSFTEIGEYTGEFVNKKIKVL